MVVPHNSQPVPNWSDCTAFTPPITSGVVIKVYDGDTVTVAARLPYEASLLYRFAVRLRGIDAPELRGSSVHEKEAANASQRALEALVLHKVVTLENLRGGVRRSGRDSRADSGGRAVIEHPGAAAPGSPASHGDQCCLVVGRWAHRQGSFKFKFASGWAPGPARGQHAEVGGDAVGVGVGESAGHPASPADPPECILHRRGHRIATDHA